MQFFTAIAAISALVAPALALPTQELPQAPTNQTLHVRLIPTGNTMVKAVVTNNGDRPLNLLKFNTIMDENPTAKVNVVHEDGEEVEFTGMLPRYSMRSLPKSVFTRLAPKDSVEHVFDIATVHNLKRSGKYTLSARGAVPVAEGDDTAIIDHVYYQSNDLTMEIDARKAALIPRAFEDTHFAGTLNRRGGLNSTCSPRRYQVIKRALNDARMIASSASKAVSSNPEKFREFFGTTDPNAMKQVSERLMAIAQASVENGPIKWHCFDSRGRCEQNVVAYTLPSRNEVFPCMPFFTESDFTNKCHAQDKPTTLIHEAAHNPSVVQPFCRDHGYGYDHVSRLPPRLALQNADNYSIYAQGKFHLHLPLKVVFSPN
ncbi:neutral protease 2 [Nannizzia gypsea CBS 118893]|uniref:Neutral protease 2 homolog MGYG_06241 n=1 Tax=Arthroderma gypseum (strain ATCC MYA-4604 / CBS 118893) TaxID=535722 RepID=NPIIF_ARTGP|nr:neutral protease 2 [Nannizzia gypsea CBS 118893]E4UYQ9.1 RecName: Full=Neutral protease 2 homolog MGYG_06241; AltName: Full=Deuterolysin MGYG_06241; Flags: Precursor [Nannizzia gypsea CBS 118893]EFR03239.1 neutral protease 2 [Nannizzia gypsea CBS 118893]